MHQWLDVLVLASRQKKESSPIKGLVESVLHETILERAPSRIDVQFAQLQHESAKNIQKYQQITLNSYKQNFQREWVACDPIGTANIFSIDGKRDQI